VFVLQVRACVGILTLMYVGNENDCFVGEVMILKVQRITRQLCYAHFARAHMPFSCMHTHTYIHTYIHTYVYIHTDEAGRMHICILHVCIHTYIHMGLAGSLVK
jgi:hypothetical protein